MPGAAMFDARARRNRAQNNAVRRARLVGVVALAGLLVWALVGIPVFVFPDTGPLPKHADVVEVLGGLTPERVATAERLLRDGTVDSMLWSTPMRPESTDPVYLRDCHRLAHLTCFVPDPSTTQGEARELRAQASANGWTSAIVVTQSAHIERAQLIVARCFSGRLTMAASGEGPDRGWAWEYLYQTLATVKAWIHPGC